MSEGKISSISNAQIVKMDGEESFFILIPISMEEKSMLSDQITYLTVKPSERKKVLISSALEKIVTDILLEIGVPASIRGFHYIRSAVLFAVSEPSSVGSVKNIYAMLSEKYEETPSRIERTIRYATTIAIDRGNEKILEKVFKNAKCDSCGRPTNKEAINAIAIEANKRITAPAI